ncbi:ShlB/FhaC/HecB family hemolysin secretion/activation protein [Erythrobacter sp. AP23]|uniref:ShlB/FhaC/HecB family hemolysin secretion/activation protein n=1 Tax=Erythrobacter sp. AP23 TaxID=499656 RepID=UPI000A514366|nr:ShlB/FhaC/HecB family hemolysin secretion/activation protein [Erythrobacter sp. AP23]
MNSKIWAVAVLVLAPTSQVAAQDAGSLLRDRERAEEPDPRETLEDEQLDVVADAEGAQVSGPTIAISQLTFDGQSDLLSEEQRADLRQRAEQRELDFAAIQSLADSATAMLRQNGHLLARAVIQPQDVTDGELTITIQAGALEEVRFERSDRARISPGLIQAIADRGIDPNAVTERGLESALLRMNDLPAVRARSRLVAGSQPGTSALVIQVDEEPVFRGAVYGDNFGSPSTGEVQGHAQFALLGAIGIGDRTSISGSVSDGQRYVSGGFEAPLGASGLSLALDYGYLDYENIDPVGQAAGLEGYAHYGSFGLDWQLVRSRRSNVSFFASANGKVLVDDSIAGRINDKRIYSGTLGFVGDVRDDLLGGAITQVSVSWTYGDLDLSRTPAAEFVDALGLQTQGGFHRVNVSLIRYQSLTDNLTLLTSASGQWASKNLDSAESFSLGGPYGVRGWPVGEGRGDMGVLATAELRFDVLGFDLGELQFSTFIDAGRVQLNEDSLGVPNFNACGCNSYSLASAGLGLNWRYERFSLSASWAHGLGSNPGRSSVDGTNVDGETDRQQFWISGSIRF